ncbi:hypothetical protein [Pseudorhodobacter sp. MZDSW-24AT]|uniref:hypothetical protein n=1 Tax=Pseudorhodobacter sp. MZDSW-24AT TaxID=2052957 RepID=UPI0026C0A119
MRPPARSPTRSFARTLAFSLMLLPLPLAAAEPPVPLTGAEFEAYTTGKTLTFSQFGQVYGAEQYLPGRKVRWAFKGDVCRDGTWYEEAGKICFTYTYNPTPQCWSFWRQDGRLTGLFSGDGAGAELSEVAQSPDPLACAGPDVGV